MEKLEVRHVSKAFDGRSVLEDVSLTLREGELVCLLGVSGGGKSTLFNIISGLLQPDAGQVFLDGEEVTGRPGKISYMLQKDLLLPYRTIVDNVALPLLLRGVPHAYSYFHVTGLHYLTVSCVLVPALSVIYFCIEGGRSRGRLVCMLLADAAAVAIPLLCVSRSQLLFAVLLALITYIQMEHQLNPIYVVFALAGLIVLYILLTIARSHDTAYLNTVFEMKRPLPIFVTQPYIYIANNYDNFDCLVKGLVKHSWGMKMLAPFWTLTGLKFLVPSLTAFPYYVTKEELTTLTMFYDAYYDFGIIGVFIFSAILGAAAYLLMRMMRQVQNPITYLLYAQFALYMLLSFFTTWFSNPSTWFYFAVTAVVTFLVSHKVAGR